MIARHPRWRGIRHPDLIDLPPPRFSRTDMLPAVRLGAEREWERRARWNAEVVAAHPRWRGIRRPDRLVFDPPPPGEREARLRYQAAVARAVARLAASERIAERLADVAAGVGEFPRPWGADPARLATRVAREEPGRADLPARDARARRRRAPAGPSSLSLHGARTAG